MSSFLSVPAVHISSRHADLKAHHIVDLYVQLRTYSGRRLSERRIAEKSIILRSKRVQAVESCVHPVVNLIRRQCLKPEIGVGIMRHAEARQIPTKTNRPSLAHLLCIYGRSVCEESSVAERIVTAETYSYTGIEHHVHTRMYVPSAPCAERSVRCGKRKDCRTIILDDAGSDGSNMLLPL